MNVSEIIRPHVKDSPDKHAIIYEDRRITYGQLDKLINSAAKAVQDMGLKKGDVLSLFLPSVPELIIAYLGTVRVGVTLNLVNAMLQKTEVSYILRDCETKVVVTDAKRLPIVEAVRDEVKSLSEIVVVEKDTGYPSFRSMLEKGRGVFDAPGTKGSDICHLMYTSGTTGWPLLSFTVGDW